MFRIGNGYDVHSFAPDRKLILCGINIPHTCGLLGHSDADVATHALMDAMLGAAALGDIGKHFPDNDSAYKGADSIELLRKVTALINRHGYSIGNADITIIAQSPKLAPYVDEMRSIIASACDTQIDAISIKATTTEGLGFTGRKEGIASIASVLLNMANMPVMK